MWKKIILLIAVILLAFSYLAKSQILTQTYIDPCDGKPYVVQFPLPNSVISIAVRGNIKTFTYADAQTGAVAIWVVKVLIYMLFR